MNFTTQLTECGCALSLTDFYQLLHKTRTGRYPDWTEEDLLCEPRKALEFCAAVREAAACKALTSPLILHALINYRKRGYKLPGTAKPETNGPRTPAGNSDTWEREVRDPAETATEGRRTVKVKGASASYRISALPDGRWALQFDLGYETGNSSFQGQPWQEYPTRADCLAAFLHAARAHFAATKLHPNDSCVSDSQRQAQKRIWKILDPAQPFVEPEPVKEVWCEGCHLAKDDCECECLAAEKPENVLGALQALAVEGVGNE
jgi:hypothetical protein